MPWRNGRGETAEVAIGPAGASLDDFDWRVSMARIDADGPFSNFPGTDRTLTVLRGEGLHLSIADSAPVELTCDSEPLGFPGDVVAAATLIGSPVTDLNVMTNRARLRHSMRRLRPAGGVELAIEAQLALLVCAQSTVQVEVNAQKARLATLDTFLVDEARTTLRIFGDALALVYLIEITGTGRSWTSAPPQVRAAGAR